jgi:hypothetical protein
MLIQKEWEKKPFLGCFSLNPIMRDKLFRLYIGKLNREPGGKRMDLQSRYFRFSNSILFGISPKARVGTVKHSQREFLFQILTTTC